MTSEVLGGGVMVAVAATLWVAYLVPVWSRRRQYLAIERNAVRLQQTLRILAETAEVPSVVRVEANARAVSARQRVLAQAEIDAELEAKAAVDAARAARRAAAARQAAEKALRTEAASVSPAAQLQRLRKRRALSSLVLLASVFVTVAGLVSLAAGGPGFLAIAGPAVAVAAFVALSYFATQAHALRVVRAPQPAARRVVAERSAPVRVAPAAAPVQTWTPQPLPRPLYLSRGSIAQAAMASVDAAADLRRAAAEAQIARRAAALATPITPITAAPASGAGGASGAASVSSSSRFASMGLVGDTAPGIGDLDAVLRLRRAAS